jgi:N-acetylmuramoyl-L-alanine amidase
MATPRIFVSPSDQFNNKYAYGNTTEGDQCKKIASALVAALLRNKFEVKMMQGPDMATVVNASNNWAADLHVCVHTNAYNGTVAGTRIYAYDKNKPGYQAALKVFNRLAPITPGTSESVQINKTWYEMENTWAPCVYCECEFHDNPTSAKWIVEHTDDIGEAIAAGICDYFGMKYIAPSKPAEPVEGDTLYRVQVGAFKVRENAERYRDKLREMGISAFIVKV